MAEISNWHHSLCQLRNILKCGSIPLPAQVKLLNQGGCTLLDERLRSE